MSSRGESIEPDEVAPGDLIFFNTTGTAAFARRHLCGQAALRERAVDRWHGAARLSDQSVLGEAFRRDQARRGREVGADSVRRADLSCVAAAGRRPLMPRFRAAGSSKHGRLCRDERRHKLRRPADRSEPAPSALATTQRQAARRRRTGTYINTPSQAQADPFEPPPPSLSAAERQSRLANAATPMPARATSAEPVRTAATALAAAQRQAQAAGAVSAAATAPDPIAAAADAFEPPPPTARSPPSRHARCRRKHPPQTNRRRSHARIDRLARRPRPSATTDDPIARFANGSTNPSRRSLSAIVSR